MSLRDEIARLTPGARRYARALIGDAEDRLEAGDQIVQEAIVRALKADFSGRRSSVKISLYVTINALARARLRMRTARASGGEDVAPPRAIGAPNLFVGVGVTQALDRLSQDEREALLLTTVEEFDYAEACEALNIPRPTLIARLTRARRGLAEQIDPAHSYDRGRRSSAPHLRLIK